MLDNLFGEILGLEEEVNLGLDLQFEMIEAFEAGALGWGSVEDAGNKRKADMTALKGACHKFFREVIWTAEQSNLTLGELLDEDEQLSHKWERVEKVVKDIFPVGTLERIRCK
jgi:hypothetical protein